MSLRYGWRIMVQELVRYRQWPPQTRVKIVASLGILYSTTAFPCTVVGYVLWLFTGRGPWRRLGHRTPPMTLIPPGLRLRGRMAPVDQDFHSWVTDHSDARTADMLSSAAGVYTFHHDPGELSAAFVWERSQRLLLSATPRRGSSSAAGAAWSTGSSAAPEHWGWRSSPASASTRFRPAQ